MFPDLALQENVVSHDVLDLDGVGPRVVEHLVEGLGVADEEVAELGRGRMDGEEARDIGPRSFYEFLWARGAFLTIVDI